MSKLLEQIKADQLAARKARDVVPSKLLTTLLGEASPSGTASATDEDVQKVIRKFIKNINETIDNTGSSDVLVQERTILQSYLPAVFDEADIMEVLGTVEQGNVGMIMGLCKQAAAAQKKLFDGALVQKVLRHHI